MVDEPGFSAIWKTAAKLALNGEDVSDLELPRKKGVPITAPISTTKSKITIFLVNKKIAGIDMPYVKHKIEQFKHEIDGRVWNGDDHRWEFPIPHIPKVFELFAEDEIVCDQMVLDVRDALVEHRKQLDEIRSQDTNHDMADRLGKLLKLPPYNYQTVGVAFIQQAEGRALVADAPGLGKTLQAIAYARLNNLKTLVVCPLAVVINWKKEVAKFTGLDVCTWTTKGYEGRLDAQYHIVHYDAVRKIYDELLEHKFDLLVCDEATHLKNRNTLRAKHILGNYKQRKKFPGIKTKHVLFLTGTPVLSRPIEAFTLLNFLDNRRFNNFYHFVQQYGGWKGEPPKNLLDLHNRSKDLVIRRKKKDVLPELPDKQRNDLYVELTHIEREQYNQLLQEIFGKWRTAGKPSVQHMPKLYRWLAGKKLPRIIQLIDEYLDNDKPILIYSCFLDPLKEIAAHYKDQSALYTGELSPSEKEAVKDSLVAGTKKVGCFSLKAGGMGIDGLQHVIDTVVFIDMDWVPANHEQAEDRTHRIGQTNKVQAYYMLCEGTTDEYMRDILKEKQKTADLIVDGALITPVNQKSFFREFVQRLKQSYNLSFTDENE